jgi:hypothetical protein
MSVIVSRMYTTNHCNAEHTKSSISSLGSWHSAVSIVTGCELGGLNPGRDKILLHNVQTGSEAHPASHPMRTGGGSPGDKVTNA